jgi:hypothetical protein
VNATVLRNRLVIATSMWREETADPLPRMEPGNPADQIQAFELKLVDMLLEGASPENAREQADKMWSIVHDRDDADPVKQRVIKHHDELAKMSHSLFEDD